MYIKKLVVKGYKRLFLAFINKLEFTPESRINIILGKNGSGKSSTLKELTPLPANMNKDYDEEGYKEIYLTHENNEYHLTSGLVGKNKHTFLVNNEELNPAGTRRVQLQLVKEHFNITPEIHDVLIGLKNFTTMTIMERKNWLTNISTVDYTYAINIFNKFKQRNRDIVGALKISQTELSKTADSIKSDQELKIVEDELCILKDLLTLATASKTPLMTNTVDVTDSIKLLTDKATEILSKIERPIDLSKTMTIDTLIAVTQSKITECETKIDKIKSILKDLSFIEDGSNVGTLDKVDENINKVTSDIKAIEDKMYFEIGRSNIESFSNLFKYLYPELISIIGTIVDNTFDNYNKDNYDKDIAKILNNENRIKDIKILISKMESQRATMIHNRDHNEVTCNKCNNIWSIGYDKKEHMYLDKKLTEANDLINKLTEETNEIKKTVEFFKNKMDAVNRFKNIVRNEDNETMFNMFKYVMSNSDLMNNGQSTIDLLFKINTDINTWLKIPILLREYDNLLKDKNIIEAKRKLELEHFNVNKDKIETELSDNTTLKRKLTNDLMQYNLYKQNINILTRVNERLIDLLRKVNNNVKLDIETLKNEQLNNSIRILNLEISKLETLITESNYNKRIIENNEKKVLDLNKRKKATDLIITGLSPTNGLIAKSITQFLDMFITDVNSIINSVWNYSIEVLPCKVTDSADLDYKFEVRVDGRNTIEDISKTSSSMQEIIDLAFKIISMKYLGMDDYPLYLDEYAASFDAHHAIKAYDAIETLSESSFNQVFMISHYENTYTRFSDADISVLDAENLLLDKDLKINRVLNIT